MRALLGFPPWLQPIPLAAPLSCKKEGGCPCAEPAGYGKGVSRRRHSRHQDTVVVTNAFRQWPSEHAGGNSYPHRVAISSLGGSRTKSPSAKIPSLGHVKKLNTQNAAYPARPATPSRYWSRIAKKRDDLPPDRNCAATWTLGNGCSLAGSGPFHVQFRLCHRH